MKTNFGVDLKVARRRSGLSQTEVAHLLGVDQARVSNLECNKASPSGDELALLSLIYSQSFLTLGGVAMPSLYRTLRDRLESLPNREGYVEGSSKKGATLKALSKRLFAPVRDTYDD